MTHAEHGVLPLGQQLLLATADCRGPGLGSFGPVDDELLAYTLLPMCDAADLCRLSGCSRALRAFGAFDALWKALLLSARPDVAIDFRHSWRVSYALAVGASPAAPRPLAGGRPAALCSDVLYQPHRVATAAENLPARWLRRQTMAREPAAGLDPARFREAYERANVPVLIEGGCAAWPAVAKWTWPGGEDGGDGAAAAAPPSYAERAFGDSTLHAGGFNFTARGYLAYMRESRGRDDQPLYVFDKEALDKAPELAAECGVPAVFPEGAADLFAALGKDRRPDWRWLIVGPKGSGSSFHVDPNGTDAWNATLSGEKKWVLFPPDVPPPGVEALRDGADVAAPVSVVEWLLSFHARAAQDPRCVEVTSKVSVCVCVCAAVAVSVRVFLTLLGTGRRRGVRAARVVAHRPQRDRRRRRHAELLLGGKPRRRPAPPPRQAPPRQRRAGRRPAGPRGAVRRGAARDRRGRGLAGRRRARDRAARRRGREGQGEEERGVDVGRARGRRRGGRRRRGRV